MIRAWLRGTEEVQECSRWVEVVKMTENELGKTLKKYYVPLEKYSVHIIDG